MLITTIIGLFIKNIDKKCYLYARICGIITSVLFITVFFYTYTGIIGTNFAIIDILSFIIAIILGEYTFYKILYKKNNCNDMIPIISLIILLLAFIIFTYFPPKIQYFKDPLTNKYGIFKYAE